MSAREENWQFYSVVWAILLAVLIMLTSVAVAFAAPKESEDPALGKLRWQLMVAQGQIIAGDLDKASKTLDAITKEGQAKLPARLAFARKLLDVVKAEKTGDLRKADATLRNASGMAKSSSEVTSVLRAGKRLLQKYLDARERSKANGLVTFLASGSGQAWHDFGPHLYMARLWLMVGNPDKAEIQLHAAASVKLPEKDPWPGMKEHLWRAWSWTAHGTATRVKPLPEALAVFERLQSAAKSPIARRAILITRARFLMMKGKTNEAEECLRQIDSEPTDETSTEDLAFAHYRLAGEYAWEGKPHEAYRLLLKAESLAASVSDEARPKLLRKGFYLDNRFVPATAHVLSRAIRSSKKPIPTHLLTEYCEAAAALGAGDQAIGLLAEVNAKPAMYLLLAKAFRRHGDVQHARKALKSIPRSALKADPALAKDVASFWPSRADRLKKEIKHRKAQIAVFEKRLKRAKRVGDKRLVAQHEKRVESLRQKLSELAKEAEK